MAAQCNIKLLMRKFEDEWLPVWSYQSPKLNKQVVEILKFNFSKSSAIVDTVKTRICCVLTCKNAEHVRRGRRIDVRAWGLNQPGDQQGIPWGKNGEELQEDDRMQNHTWKWWLRVLCVAGEILPGYHSIELCNLIQQLQSVIVGTILTSRFSQLRYKTYISNQYY